MSAKTSRRLQREVLDVLRMQSTPLRTSEIARMLGKSVTAIANALEDAGASKVEDVSPAEWTYPVPKIGDPDIELQNVQKGERYAVYGSPEAATIDRWNANRQQLGKAIAGLNITYKSDAKDISTRLATVAGAMASLAYQIELVQDKPEWYLLLTDNQK